MHRLFLTCLLALTGCNTSVETEQRAPRPAATATAQPLTPAPRAVRIGEGGPGFAACQSRGVVSLPDGEAAASLQVAPFREAATMARVAEGTVVRVCTRTLDQRWLGVVIATTLEAGCGVGGRIDRPRDYAGPCPSGWVATNEVRLTGN